MKKVAFLKQTHPVSKYDRKCDAYEFILNNTTKQQRKQYNINDDDLQKVILKGEKYLYRVAKENSNFKTMSISYKNFEIIRKNIELFKDYIDE